MKVREKKYAPNIFCVVGSTPAPASTSVAAQHGRLLISLVFNGDTGEILEAQCNLTLDLSAEYICSMLVGLSLYTDLEKMIALVQQGYSGMCSKGLAVCLKDAHQKIRDRMANCPMAG